jgi:Lrp/AsnC family leucine-responsive transcriptional regulator
MIDEISLKILKILQEKARIPNVEVARQVGMAPSAVLERIRKLEKMGFIDGYEVRLNPDRFAKSQVAFVNVRMEPAGNREAFVAALTAIPQIQEIHYVAGQDGYLLKIRETDPRSLGRLVRQQIAPLPGVRATDTTIVMDTLKETARIPIEHPNSVPVHK